VPFTFTVTTTGYPAPKLSKTGTLPHGITFTDHGDGTATLSGTPAATVDGDYAITVTAKSSAGTTTQIFTLTMRKPPAIKTIPNTTAHVGTPLSITIVSTGDPTATVTESGPLPAGVVFTDNGDGTAAVAGTPSAGTRGAYPITITATNELGTSTALFALRVNEAPAITSAASIHAVQGTPFSFHVITTGYPAPTLSKSGSLPRGVTFQASTGTLGGSPATGTAGTYTIVITAKNSTSTVSQTLTLTVSQTGSATVGSS
jgi:hypothetical protein